MIGSHQGRTAFVKLEIGHLQPPVKVNVIQMQQGQNSGVGLAAANVSAKITALEMKLQQTRGKAVRPFIKIPENNLQTLDVSARHHLLIEKTTSLLPALEIGRPQMKVENVQQAALSKVNICSQASATFAPADGNVMILGMVDGKTRENQISVGPASVFPIFAQFRVIPKFFCKIRGLLIPPVSPFPADHLLKSDDVRIHLAQHLGDALGTNPSIQTTALVDVVGGDAQANCGA